MTTVPALGFTAEDQASLDSPAYYWEADMYIPSAYQIDSSMTIVAADSGSTNPSAFLGE